MHRRFTMAILSFVAAAAGVTVGRGGDGAAGRVSLTLVRDGAPAGAIVIARRPTHTARFAAKEVQQHIQKITGATLPVVSADAKTEGVRILVGESAATRALGLKSAGFKGQEYLIRFLPNTLVLMGRDEPDDPHLHPAYTLGKFGQAFNFAGAKTPVEVKGRVLPDAEGTLEAWVYLPAPKDRQGVMLTAGPEWWDNHHRVYCVLNSLKIAYHVHARHLPRRGTKEKTREYVGKIVSRDLRQGWHHIMATHSLAKQRMELFVDGNSHGTATYALPTRCQQGGLLIGANYYAGVLAGRVVFHGAVDEVRVSDVARTPGPDANGGPYVPDAHTVLLLHCDREGGKGARNLLCEAPFGPSGQKVPGTFFPGKPALKVQFYQPAEWPPVFNHVHCTLYAVYDFLERHCGVRWYAPTELGMVCPARKTLTVAGTEVRRSPVFAVRTVSAPPHTGRPYDRARMVGTLMNNPSRDETWRFLHRMRAGGEPYACNHAFYGYYPRFWREDPMRPNQFEGRHPEYFAKGYPYKPPQMCYTDPGLIRRVVQDARDYFDGKGVKRGAQAAGDYFAVGPMDHSGWCVCPGCSPEFHKEEWTRLRKPGDDEPNPMFANVQRSEYLFGFANKVAREIKKTHPGKYISLFSYWVHSVRPTTFRLEDNVSVQFCLQVRSSTTGPRPMVKGDPYYDVYREWLKHERGKRPMYVWLYYCIPDLESPADRKWHYFPPFFTHYIAGRLRGFAADGIRGAFLNDWTQQVDMYVTFKLLDDPYQDVDKLLDEFFALYYGSAGEPMKALHRTIEQTYCNRRNYPDPKERLTLEEISWDYLGTESRMSAMAQLMDKAKASAVTQAEKRRVALFEKGVWNYMVEGRRKHKESNRKAEYDAMRRKKAESAGQRERMVALRKKSPPPRVRVPRVKEPLGGDPAKVDWAKGVSLGALRTMMLTPPPAGHHATGYLLHDGTYLYVKLEETRHPPKALVSGKDVFAGDTWELFFAAHACRPYRQIAVGPKGRFKALAWCEGDGRWDSQARVVSNSPTPGRWTVLLAVPLSRLLPTGAKPGTAFRANFFRNSGRLCWSPTLADTFHKPARMGEVLLGE